jgi:hypothetical protein
MGGEPATPAPQRTRIPAALQLQRMAGNRALVQLLQRTNVTGTVTTNPAQKHHPFYRFTYPDGTADKLFELDKWITDKIDSPAVAHAALQPGTAAAVRQLVHAWDGNASIIGQLIDTLIATAPVTDWKAADISPAVLGGATGKSIVPLLLSLKANLKLREDDIPNNVPTNFNIKGTPKVPTARNTKTDVDKTVGWGSVLKDARLALKGKLDKQDPEWAPADKKDVRLVDDAIETSTDAALVELRRIGALEKPKSGPQKGRQRFDASPHTGKGGTVVNYTVTHEANIESFNFGMNHLTFILWMEWKLLTELMRPQQ